MTDDGSRPDEDAPRAMPSVLDFVSQKTGRESHVTLPDDDLFSLMAPVIDPGSAERRSLPQGRGQYQLMGEIARGGMGVVLRGHDPDLGRDVALKVLHKELAADPEVLQRFVEEAQVGGQLQHPGIVPVYELGLMADERPYFTMKLVKGKTLAALLAERATASDDRPHLVGIFESVCQTIAYAHSRGVIHRDLKPSNIMVGAFGEVQVVDWGLAKVLRRGGAADDARSQRGRDPETKLDTVRRPAHDPQPEDGGADSVEGSIMGTPAYMPPEQAAGRVEDLDERSDVFCLGAILCEILTGEPPYPGELAESYERAVHAHQDEALERLEKSDAPEGLIELTRQCLLPSQPSRPANAELVAQRVQQHRRSTEERARRAEVDAAVQRRAKWLWSLIVGIVVLFGGGGSAYLQWQKAEELGRTFAIESDLREARYEAESLAERARAGSSLDLWDLARTSALRAQTIAASHGLVQGPEVDRLVGEIEAGRQGFLKTHAQAARREAFLETIAELSRSPVTLIGSDQRKQSHSERYASAFRTLGVDVARLSVDEASAALGAAGLGPDSDHGEALGQALDTWAGVAAESTRGRPLAEQLIDLADRVDPNALRKELRRLSLSNDVEALERVATSREIHEASPSSVMTVTALLSRNQAPQYMSSILEAARANHPGDYAMNLMHGVLITWSGGDLDEALAFVTAAEALEPEDVSASVFRAGILAALGRDEAAVATLDRALELTLDAELFFTVSGLASGFRISRRPQALERLEALLRRRSNVRELRLALAPVLYEKEDYAGAIPLLREAIETLENPDASLWYRLAVCQVMTDAHAEAIETSREALRLEPDRPGGLHALSWILSTCPDPGLRDPALAVTLSDRACSLEPDVGVLMEGLAAALHRAGRHEEALGVLDLCAELNNGDLRKPAAYFRAMALHASGDTNGARAALAAAARLPDHFGNPTQDALWSRQLGWIRAEAEQLVAGE